MITLEKFKNSHFLRLCISQAFIGDERLRKYHIKPSDDLQEMIDDTFNTIMDSSKELGLDWYSVVFTDGVFNKHLIGFVCVSVSRSLIYSFGINIEFRKKDILKEWIRKVERIFKSNNIGNCSVILYTKNRRAVSFFMKNGYAITFNNYKLYEDTDPITGLSKTFNNYILNVHDLEFECGLG